MGFRVIKILSRIFDFLSHDEVYLPRRVRPVGLACFSLGVNFVGWFLFWVNAKRRKEAGESIDGVFVCLSAAYSTSGTRRDHTLR